MFKNISVLEVKGAEKRIYKFYCDPKSPLGEVYDAISTMKLHIFEQMKLRDIRDSEEKRLLESSQEES